MARKSLRCQMFGHKMPEEGWWGDGRYGAVTGGYMDGIGRTHFEVRHDCPRCGTQWIAARFHGHAVTGKIKDQTP